MAITLLLAPIIQIPGLESLAPYSLPHQYESWQGLLRTPTDWAPIRHSAWVCTLYAIGAVDISASSTASL